MAVTARDVAREAGVSPATVSLVFRDRPGVGKETRQRVREVAKRLGFEYQGSQAPSKASTLQLVIYEKHGRVVGETPFFQELIRGVSEEARACGYPNLSISYFFASEDARKQVRGIQTTKAAGVILLCTEMDASALRTFERLGVPLVLLDSWFPGKMCDSVVIDNQCATWMAVNQLSHAGHTEIGHLRSKAPIRNFRERDDGYKVAMMQAAGPRFDAEAHTIELEPSLEGAYADMCTWLDAGNVPCTAYFADNDFLAAGALSALQQAGYRVPEDVSLIGFDDMPVCTAVAPNLSTMRVSKRRMGALTVKRLVSVIQRGQTENIRLTVLPELVLRDSIAAPREGNKS